MVRPGANDRDEDVVIDATLLTDGEDLAVPVTTAVPVATAVPVTTAEPATTTP